MWLSSTDNPKWKNHMFPAKKSSKKFLCSHLFQGNFSALLIENTHIYLGSLDKIIEEILRRAVFCGQKKSKSQGRFIIHIVAITNQTIFSTKIFYKYPVFNISCILCVKLQQVLYVKIIPRLMPRSRMFFKQCLVEKERARRSSRRVFS